MADNVFAVSNLVAQTMTEFFVQKSPLLNTSNRWFEEQFLQQSYMTGGTINIKIPGYPTVQLGLSVTPEAIQDFVVPYTITQNDIYNIPRQLDLYQQRFDIRRQTEALTDPIKKAIVDNYAYPAFLVIESALEQSAAVKLANTAFLSPIDEVSKLGSINTYSAISSVTAFMDQLQFSPMDRTMMMNISDATAVANSLQNMFNETINMNITKTARIGGPDKGRLAGLDMYQSPQLFTHIAGPLAGNTGITVDTISSDGGTITFQGVGSSTGVLVKAGDRISIPSVFLCNPITKAQVNYKLVVTAAQDANGNGDGTVDVIISYPLMASGEHQNVRSLPANSAPAYVFPDYNMNYAYVKSGLSAVALPMGDIHGATNSNVKGENNCPVKVVAQGQVSEWSNIFRISMMAVIQPFAQYVVALPSLAV